MKNQTRALLYLVTASFQAALILYVATVGGQYLDNAWPQAFSWRKPALFMGFSTVIFEFYVLFKNLLKMEEKDKEKRE